jgi:hypothetical protein
MGTTAEWLRDLKVGDEAAVVAHHMAPRIVTITRATKLHVEADGRKFSRKHGTQLTDGWSKPEIVPVTSDHRLQIEYATLRTWLQRVADATRGGSPPSLQQLRAMRDAYDAEESNG